MCVLQSFHCSPTPRQPLPPLWGDGLSHRRFLNLTPPPHESEHFVHGLHWLQPPSTWQPGSDTHNRTPASQELRKIMRRGKRKEVKYLSNMDDVCCKNIQLAHTSFYIHWWGSLLDLQTANQTHQAIPMMHYWTLGCLQKHSSVNMPAYTCNEDIQYTFKC